MSVGLKSFDHARFRVVTAVLVYTSRYIKEELAVSLIRVVQGKHNTMTIERESCSETLLHIYKHIKCIQIKLATTCNKDEHQQDAKNNAEL